MDKIIFDKVTTGDWETCELICKDDPICPRIPYHWRVCGPWRQVYYIRNDENTCLSGICVAHSEKIPITEKELLDFDIGDIAVFYTVWSNVKGLGKQIILKVMEELKATGRSSQYVTMSPKTEMATKFHLSNGGVLIQENKETNNFEY